MKELVSFITIVILVLIVMITICAYTTKQSELSAFEEGVKARQNNVESIANPYVLTYERKAWLNGWMEGKE